MITININDVSRDLPGFLQRLHAGETVFIVQDDLPVAELKPLPAVSVKTMSGQQIVQLVRQYLHPIKDVMAVEILEQSVRQDGHWWYVPVRLVEPKLKTYRYYGELAEVESELKEHENIDVLLVPSG